MKLLQQIFHKPKLYDYKKSEHAWVSNFQFSKPCTIVYPEEDTVNFYTIETRPMKHDLLLIPHGNVTGKSIMYEVIKTFPIVADVRCTCTIRWIPTAKAKILLAKFYGK